jgi:hypothetical protein
VLVVECIFSTLEKKTLYHPTSKKYRIIKPENNYQIKLRMQDTLAKFSFKANCWYNNIEILIYGASVMRNSY